MNATQRAAREARPSQSEPEDDLAEQLSSYRRRVQALQTVYEERIPHELEQLLLARASLDAEEYSYRWAVYSATLDECILVYASLVEEARELQRSARRAGESSLALEMESGITAMETSLLGLREQRAEAEGIYQQMQDLLRQPDTQSSVDAPRAALGGPRIVGDVLPLTKSSGERCTEDEICPSPWIQYERTTNFPGQGPETHDAWFCQSRSRWCWVAGDAWGEGCFCSGTQPSGTWTRVDDRSDVSVVPNPWAAPLQPVTDLSPGETHVAWDELEVGNSYRLMNSVELMAWGRNGPVLGQMFVNAGRIFVVRKIDRLVPDDPWYHVRVVTFGSLDPNNDSHGWIKGTEFMEHGVAEQP